MAVLLPLFFVRGFPQHVAATPHGFEVVFAAGGVGQFFAQIAEEDVNDFNLRPVAATVKVVQDHFLGQCHALAQTQKFENLILLASEVHVCAVPERTGDLETSYHVEERSVLNNLEGWPPLSTHPESLFWVGRSRTFDNFIEVNVDV